MNIWKQYVRPWLERQPFFQKIKEKTGTKKQTQKKPWKQWIKWLLLLFIVFVVVNFIQGTLVLDLSLNASAIFTLFFLVSVLTGIIYQYKPALAAAGLSAVLYLVLIAYSSTLFHYQAHRDLIG